MDINKTFAENVRAYRRRNGLSQEEMAHRSGLHRTYIGGIEQKRKNPSLKSVAKIAEVLDVDPALLFIRSNDPSGEEGTGPGSRPQASATHAQPASESHNEKSILDFKPGDYALCSWTDDGIRIEPIDVTNEDVSLRILSILANDGYTDDLAAAYESLRTKASED